MNSNNSAKEMFVQEERELRRVFEHVACFHSREKHEKNMALLEDRQRSLQKCRSTDCEVEWNDIAKKIAQAQRELSQIQNGVRCIRYEDLMDVMKSLGKVCSQKEIKTMIWEADENLDGVIDWTELCEMFNRTLLDKTELEPVNLFNVVQFLTYDKKNSGVITADDTMAILFARYGSSELESRMKEMFGEYTELTFVQYLERVGRHRKVNVDLRGKNDK